MPQRMNRYKSRAFPKPLLVGTHLRAIRITSVEDIHGFLKFLSNRIFKCQSTGVCRGK